MSFPNDWMQLNFNDQNQTYIPPTTTATTTTAATATSTAAISRNAEQGRGARPIRRRSRASRRTPTTLLNTDTANFRAMVQQFTGDPTSAAAAAGNSAGMFDFTQHVPSNLYMQGRGAHHVQQQQRHVFMVGDVHGRGGGRGGGGHAPPESSDSLNESRDYDGYML